VPTTVQGHTLRIRIEVPREVAGRVTLYDSDGRLVRHLFEGSMPAGTWALDWDQKNDHGSRVAAGAYIVQIEADGKVMTGRVSVAPGV
jgi:flagellar hook assembly protein FlgD